MGAPVNLAARLESAAPPGGLLISHNTYRHVAGLFDADPMPPITAKGFDEPITVYLVKRLRPRTFYIPRRGVEGVQTRMVGREMELHLLQDTLYQILQSSEVQVITLVGDAGVGKSRLLSEFVNWVEALPESRAIFLGRSRQGRQSQPYALLRNLLSLYLDIQESDPAEAVHQKVEAGLSRYASPQSAHIAGQLLGFDFSHSPYLKDVRDNPQQLRDQGTKAIVYFFRAAVQTTPVLMCLEDIHWADDSSLDLIDLLGRSLQDQRLMIVYSARGSFFERRPYWGEGQAFHRQVRLRPLTKFDSRQLVEEILCRVEDLPESLRELVVSGAEGNPFYIEEMIKMLIEQGVIGKGDAEGAENKPARWIVAPDRLAQARVPPTLTGVLQARLDSLPAVEREVLQQAAVIGRQFWDRAVESIHGEANPEQDIEVVATSLASLRSRELILHREASQITGTSEYIFKHEVLRQVTYESIPLRRRRIFHKQAAEWLLSRSKERLGEYTEQVADHLELAGQKKEAIECLLQSGDQAVARFANSDAIQYYRRGLELLDDLPESPQRDELELELWIALGVALVQQKGYGELETVQAYQSAYDLCLRLDRPPSSPVLRGLAIAEIAAGDLDQSFQYGLQLLGQAEQLGDSILLTEAHYVLGVTAYWQGEFQRSKEHLELALKHYRIENRNRHLARFSQDPQVVCLSRLSLTLWYLGFPDQAVQKMDESILFARKLGHFFSLSYVLIQASVLAILLSDLEKTRLYAHECMALSLEHQANIQISVGHAGWADAEPVPSEADINRFSRLIADFKSDYNWGLLVPFNHYLFSDLLERSGRISEGLSELETAITETNRQGVKWLWAELLRRKGEILKHQPASQLEAESFFQQALQVAREQGARSLELRASLSLGELWREQSKDGAARELVQNIYSEFSEGFDTPDLCKAAEFLHGSTD